MFKKIAYLPLVIILGAYSWFLYLLGEGGTDGQARIASLWGLDAPGMASHWSRLLSPTDPSDPLRERVKNIGSEWARFDPQRAYKASSFVYILTILILIITVTIMAVV